MWPPQSVNTWLTPASLSVRATSSPPVILAEGATPSESPRRSLQTRLAARVAEPPRPPLGSHDRDLQTRLAARVAEPPRPPLGSHDHDPDAPEWTSTSRAPILILLGPLLMIPGMDGTGSPGPRGARSEGLGGR